jgi:hypothetical protein
MLFAATTGLGAPAAELAQLQARVADCLSRKQEDLARGRRGLNAVIASGCSNGVFDALRKIETVTFIEKEDQALVFNVARTLLQQWRSMDADGGVDDKEADIRRIAAQKLTDHAFLNPLLAIQQLSAAGRLETDARVLGSIVIGLRELVSKDTVTKDVALTDVNADAINTLVIISRDPDLAVRTAAQVAINVIRSKLAPTFELEIGPVTVTSLGPSKAAKVALVVTIVATAALTTGALWMGLRRRRYA